MWNFCDMRYALAQKSVSTHRHRFTSHSAAHDPSSEMTIWPASATAITGPPAAASDEAPSMNGESSSITTNPPRGAAANMPTNETTRLTIQPSTPRFFVHASWMPTASAAATTTAAMVNGPPTLDSGIEPVNCKSTIAITAISTMYFTTSVRA